jgi:hypothetical protein
MPVIDGTMALMTAIRTALLADSGLAALGITEVYDRPPSIQVLPFVTIGATRYSDWSFADNDGQEIFVDVSAWDGSKADPNTLVTRQIMERLRVILHFATLTLGAPSRCVLCQVINSVGPMLDPDGSTLHGVVSIRALVDHT